MKINKQKIINDITQILTDNTNDIYMDNIREFVFEFLRKLKCVNITSDECLHLIQWCVLRYRNDFNIKNERILKI